MRVAWRVIAAVAAAALAMPVAVAPARAVAQTPASAAKLAFADFEPWTDPSRPLKFTVVVTNSGSEPIEDPVLRTTIYRRVQTRSALRVALEGRRLRNVIAATTDSFGEPIPPGETRRFPVSHELPPLANVFKARSIGGVYPVEIALTAAGSERELATGVTALVYFNETPEPKLNVSIVLPLHRPPAFSASDGGFADAALARDLGPGGYVAGAANLLAAVPHVPLTVAPSGLLLDQLADLADGYRRAGRLVTAEDDYAQAATKALDELRQALGPGTIELASATYASADLIALVQSGLAADALNQIVAGRTAVEKALGRAPDPAILVPAGLRMDARTAEKLRPVGVERMVVAADALPPQSSIFGPDHPLTARAAGGRDYAVLLSDAATAARLVAPGDTDSRLVAQGVIAEAAMAWFERPARAPTRSFVIAPPALPHPAILRPLVTGLAGAPWLTLRTASAMIATLPPPEESQPFLVAGPSGGRLPGLVRAADATIDTLAQVASAGNPVTQELERLVLVAESFDWAAQPARAAEFADGARLRARRILDKIAVVPPDPNDPKAVSPRKVTLTSRAGPLPVTVQNDTGFPVTLQVRVSSAKVEFTRNTHAMEEIAERETVTFAAAARASGLSPVRVELLTCRNAPPGPGEEATCVGGEGGRLIGTGTVLVQSSAVSAVALAATGGGAAFILAAWVRRGVRRRRNGAPAPPAQPGPPDGA